MGEEVGGDGHAVRLFQVQLLQGSRLVQAANGGDQYPICISLCPKPLDMSWEEEGDVLHQLLSNSVIVARHLKGTEHLVACI